MHVCFWCSHLQRSSTFSSFKGFFLLLWWSFNGFTSAVYSIVMHLPDKFSHPGNHFLVYFENWKFEMLMSWSVNFWGKNAVLGTSLPSLSHGCWLVITGYKIAYQSIPITIKLSLCYKRMSLPLKYRLEHPSYSNGQLIV